MDPPENKVGDQSAGRWFTRAPVARAIRYARTGEIDQLSRSETRILDVTPFTFTMTHELAGALVTTGNSDIILLGTAISYPDPGV